jgi:hypothetical protein
MATIKYIKVMYSLPSWSLALLRTKYWGKKLIWTLTQACNRKINFSLIISPRGILFLKSYIFWDITPCSSLKVNHRFRGTCRLQIHGRRISQERNQREAGSKKSFNGPHGVMSQKIERFTTTAVRTSKTRYFLRLSFFTTSRLGESAWDTQKFGYTFVQEFYIVI